MRYALLISFGAVLLLFLSLHPFQTETAGSFGTYLWSQCSGHCA